MHLDTYFFTNHRLDASRHFLENFFAILNHFWHLNFTDCLRGEGFALDFNNSLQTLSKPFLFLSHYIPQTLPRITLAKVVSPMAQHRRAQAPFNLPPHHCITLWFLIYDLYVFRYCEPFGTPKEKKQKGSSPRNKAEVKSVSFFVYSDLKKRFQQFMHVKKEGFQFFFYFLIKGHFVSFTYNAKGDTFLLVLS